jgi:glyoxylase-like metal-dependent hydrolase (beta-lactamase superfamily II)
MAGSSPIALRDITIHPVVEQQGVFFEALAFFPGLTKELLDENRRWLLPAFVDATDKLVLCIQGFVVKTPHHNILIDACVGNHKPRPTRPFWNMLDSDRFEKALAAAGVTVNDIDYVMCTHLHTDHVGWNTRLENGRWVPTFPKAKYIMSDRELAHWTQREKDNPASVPWITDSVLPIVAANRAQIVKSDFAFNEQVHCVPTPGHTIDHFSVHVGRPGADALITGDMIHSPLQGKYPELGMMADYDSAQAGRTRRKIFDRFCEEPTIMFATHFPAPSTGRVRRWGDGYKFIAADG